MSNEFDIQIEMGDARWKIVEENDDGTFKVLAKTDDKYLLYPCVSITFRVAANEEGTYMKAVTKEYWDSFGKGLPEDTQSR